jgi:hypothetical protein
LSTEVLRHQRRESREALIVPPRRVHGAPPRLLGVAEDADADVDAPAPEWLVPVLRSVLPVVTELLGARGHPEPERFREALQRVLRNAQRDEPGVADGHRDPGLAGLPPTGGRIDMRSQPLQELATGPRILHMEHDVRAVVRLGPIAQHRRLDVVELHGDRSAWGIDAEPIDECHGVLLTSIWLCRIAGAASGASTHRPCRGRR